MHFNSRPFENKALRVRELLTDVRSLCRALALLTKPGATQRQAMVCCPWHADRTPSCSVRLAPDGTIAVKCHACSATADALGLIKQVRGIDRFEDVLREAAEIAHAPGLIEGPDYRPERRDEPSISDEDYASIWEAVLDTCSPMRSTSPRVGEYLLGRGIYADAEAAGVRGLPRDGRALVASLLASFDRKLLELAGVLRAGVDEIEWPAYSVLIPWRDRFGRISCVQRRRLDDVKPKYLSPRGSSPRAPFGVEHLAAALEYHGPDAEIIITEGALDCLARRRIARAQDERAAVIGVYSASSPAVGLPIELMRRRQVVLALDDDKDGDRACAEIANALNGAAARLIRARPIGFKDWGSALMGAVG
jgi:DNA primase